MVSRGTGRSLILCGFSADGSKLTVSTEDKFLVLDVALQRLTGSNVFGGMRSVNCLHHSGLYLLVPSGDKPGISPRRAKIWKESQVLQELSLKSTIERTMWNKTHLVLVTDQQLFIYDLKTLALKSTLAHQLHRHCAALSTLDRQLLCYPSPDVVGEILVYDCNDSRLLNRFPAHRSEISQLAMNARGTMVATSSSVGTLVRVFHVPSGDLLHTFRISNITTQISSLHFCFQNPLYLLVGSANSTWSICYLGEKKRVSRDEFGNARALDFTAEEGDFCKIDLNQDDEGLSIASSHHSRPAALAAAAQEDADTAASNLFSAATAQYLFDFTMKSVQQIRNISQDYMATQTPLRGSTSSTTSANNSSGTQRLPGDSIRSPDWQCSINIDGSHAEACLVVLDSGASMISVDDDMSTIAGSEHDYNQRFSTGIGGARSLNADIDGESWLLQLLLISAGGVFRRYVS